MYRYAIQMISHNYLKVLTIVAAIFILNACSEDATQAKKRPQTDHLVEIAPASIKHISVEKTLAGTLEALRSVQIYNQEEGLLATLPFYEGDVIEKDAILATLDDALIKADLNKAKAAFKQTKLDLKRLKNLSSRKLASDDEIAKAQTALDIAQAELNRQTTKMAHMTIKAPFGGIISKRMVEPGDVIPVYTHMLTLIDTNSLKAKIYISELLLPLIQQNDEVDIKIDALGDHKFTGKVIRTHPTIDPNTRRGIIEIELSPIPDGALPGQLCRVTLNTKAAPRLMIPFDAVRHDNDGAYIYVIDENKAKRVNVRTGLQNNEEIEILEGIHENTNVVTRGFFGLNNNKQVKVK